MHSELKEEVQSALVSAVAVSGVRSIFGADAAECIKIFALNEVLDTDHQV
jgi:hypothetical protein